MGGVRFEPTQAQVNWMLYATGIGFLALAAAWAGAPEGAYAIIGFGLVLAAFIRVLASDSKGRSPFD